MNMNPNRFPANAKLCSAEIISRFPGGSYVVDVYFESDIESGNMCIEASFETAGWDDEPSVWFFYEEGASITPPQSFLDWHDSDREEFCLE